MNDSPKLISNKWQFTVKHGGGKSGLKPSLV